MSGELSPIEFVRARLDDELAACDQGLYRDGSEKRRRWAVEAMRAIVAEHVTWTEHMASLGISFPDDPYGDECWRCFDENQRTPDGMKRRAWWVPSPCPTMLALASIWQDHPDYVP